MANIEKCLKRLGFPVDQIEPKPSEPVMAKWLRSFKAGETNRGIIVVNGLLNDRELATVTIFEQQGPDWDDEFTILHGVRNDGTDVFAILDQCIDAKHLGDIVETLPKSAWHDAHLIVQ